MYSSGTNDVVVKSFKCTNCLGLTGDIAQCLLNILTFMSELDNHYTNQYQMRIFNLSALLEWLVV